LLPAEGEHSSNLCNQLELGAERGRRIGKCSFDLFLVPWAWLVVVVPPVSNENPVPNHFDLALLYEALQRGEKLFCAEPRAASSLAKMEREEPDGISLRTGKQIERKMLFVPALQLTPGRRPEARPNEGAGRRFLDVTHRDVLGSCTE
jgi:hypothetical protein